MNNENIIIPQRNLANDSLLPFSSSTRLPVVPNTNTNRGRTPTYIVTTIPTIFDYVI